MSAKSAEKYRHAEKGDKVCYNPGPLSFKSREEWIRWLDYIPDFYQKRIDYLLEKTIKEITNEELEELNTFKTELKMRTIAKKYQNKETSTKDRLDYIDYTTQNRLDSLIRKKLTAQEYKFAIAKIYEIVEKSSFEELSEYYKSGIHNLNNLSMIDLFILREVSKLWSVKCMEETRERLARNKPYKSKRSWINY